MTANRNHPYDMKMIVDQVRQYFGILNRVDATANGALGRSSQAQVIENLRSDFDPAEGKVRLTLDHARAHQPFTLLLLLQPGENRVLFGPVDVALKGDGGVSACVLSLECPLGCGALPF